MFKRTDVQWNHNTYYTNLWTDDTKVALKDSDRIAIRIRIDCIDTIYEGDDIRDILNITFTHQTQYVENDIIRFKNKEIEYNL